MLGTTPSATSWRAISRQSQVDRERPRSSGRSQAILTRCNATSGGKDRLAAGSGLVSEAVEPMGPESLGPLAGVPHAHAAGPGGLHEGLAPFEQEQETSSSGQSGGAGGGPLPAFDLGADFRGQMDRQGGFAATHGDIKLSGGEKEGEDHIPSMIARPMRPVNSSPLLCGVVLSLCSKSATRRLKEW